MKRIWLKLVKSKKSKEIQKAIKIEELVFKYKNYIESKQCIVYRMMPFHNKNKSQSTETPKRHCFDV
jgi:hypothetical protein